MSRGKKVALSAGLAALVLGVLGPLGYTYAALSFAYSSGERVGFVQKLSKRGWLCKTNEGDLAMVNLPGQPAEMFAFTVRDDAVADQIDKLAGKRVALVYEEHRGVPLSCFGDTPYFVTGVRATE